MVCVCVCVWPNYWYGVIPVASATITTMMINSQTNINGYLYLCVFYSISVKCYWVKVLPKGIVVSMVYLSV